MEAKDLAFMVLPSTFPGDRSCLGFCRWNSSRGSRSTHRWTVSQTAKQGLEDQLSSQRICCKLSGRRNSNQKQSRRKESAPGLLSPGFTLCTGTWAAKISSKKNIKEVVSKLFNRTHHLRVSANVTHKSRASFNAAFSLCYCIFIFPFFHCNYIQSSVPFYIIAWK